MLVNNERLVEINNYLGRELGFRLKGVRDVRLWSDL
jgi:hypothetical protein